MVILFFFFNDTATAEIYTLSLLVALPISVEGQRLVAVVDRPAVCQKLLPAIGQRHPGDRDRRGDPEHVEVEDPVRDRKSTRLNSSHANISYAVFCLKKEESQLDDTTLHWV